MTESAYVVLTSLVIAILRKKNMLNYTDRLHRVGYTGNVI